MIDFISIALYVTLGFGVSRSFSKTNSKFGKNASDNILTLFIWPLFLVVVAMNEDIFNDYN